MMPLRLYSQKDLAPNDTVALLAPFWGIPDEEFRDPFSGRFNKYYKSARELFELTDLAEAEVAVLPCDYSSIRDNPTHVRAAVEFTKRVASSGKKTVVFSWHDSSERLPFDVDETIVFKTAIDRSRRLSNEFVLPAWTEDIIATYCGGELPIRCKRARPRVSFCGRASAPDDPIKDRVRKHCRRLKKWLLTGKKDFPYLTLRAACLRTLRDSPLVDSDFIVRSDFWGGTPRSDPAVDPQLRLQLRHEYIANLLNCDYVLCVRGAGNFSIRFYETLCAGRIPILVDSGGMLPFEDEIDWDRYCLWIKQRDVHRLPHRLEAFHRKLSPDDFATLQIACRNLWEQWISPLGFYTRFSKNIFDGIENIKINTTGTGDSSSRIDALWQRLRVSIK